MHSTLVNNDWVILYTIYRSPILFTSENQIVHSEIALYYTVACLRSLKPTLIKAHRAVLCMKV